MPWWAWVLFAVIDLGVAWAAWERFRWLRERGMVSAAWTWVTWGLLMAYLLVLEWRIAT